MDISSTFKHVQRLMGDNSPSILTGLAVAGVITTAVMAVRATPKALLLMDEEINTRQIKSLNTDLTKMDIVKLTWKCYTPSAAFGATTIACMVGANTISSKKATAMMSVISVTETALKEYQSKVVETLGDKADQKIRDGVAKDRLDHNPPPSSSEIQIVGAGEMLCYDSLSGRYFKCDMETIRKAQNDINADILNNMYASQNDFYALIGLESNTYGENAGWNTEHMMDLVFSTHLSEDGRPCLSINYRYPPILEYHRIH